VPEPEGLVSTPAVAGDDARAALLVLVPVLGVVAEAVLVCPQPLITMPATSAATVMVAAGRAALPGMVFLCISGSPSLVELHRALGGRV